eukprot:1344643-Rhodomonas_salina.2
MSTRSAYGQNQEDTEKKGGGGRGQGGGRQGRGRGVRRGPVRAVASASGVQGAVFGVDRCALGGEGLERHMRSTYAPSAGLLFGVEGLVLRYNLVLGFRVQLSVSDDEEEAEEGRRRRGERVS